MKLWRSRHRWDSFGGLFVSCENLIASCHLTMKFLVLWGFHTKWTTFKLQSATFAFHRQTPRDEVRKEAKHLIYTHVCNLKKPVSFPLLLWGYTVPHSKLSFSVMTMTCLKRFSDNPWRNKNDQAGPFSVRWRSLVLVAGDWSSFP